MRWTACWLVASCCTTSGAAKVTVVADARAIASNVTVDGDAGALGACLSKKIRGAQLLAPGKVSASVQCVRR
jgi:hypothetical protein